MFFYYWIVLFSLGTVCGSSSSSSSSSSIPSSSSAAMRTRVLSLDTKKDAAGATKFYLKQHDLGANEAPPANAICVRTSHNVFYIDMGSGMQVMRPKNLWGLPVELQAKILKMALNGLLSNLGACEALRNAQGVAYTDVKEIYDVAGSMRINAGFYDGNRYFLDMNGQEVALKDAQGVQYKNVSYIRFVAGGTKIAARLNDDDDEGGIDHLFDVNGQEVALEAPVSTRNARRWPYIDVKEVYDVAGGTRIAAKLFDDTFRLFDVDGQEVGALRNAQGIYYKKVLYFRSVKAGGTRIVARRYSNGWTVHLFDLNGKEVGVLRNAQGVPYDVSCFIYDVAGGTRIVAKVLNDGTFRLFDLDGQEAGVLSNTQGVPYTNLQDDIKCIANGTRIVAKLYDETLHLFDVNGQEVGVLRNMWMGRPVAHRYDVAGGTRIVSISDNEAILQDVNGGHLALTNARGVEYLNVTNIYNFARGTRIAAELAYQQHNEPGFNNDDRISYFYTIAHLFDLDGQEVALRNTHGVAYTNVNRIYDVAGGTRIAARLGGYNIAYLFDVNGQEMEALRNAQGIPYEGILSIYDVAGGTRIAAWLNDGTVHLFEVNGQEVGVLRNAQGVPYKGILSIYDVAGGTRINAIFDDGTVHLFEVNGQEAGVLRNAQGRRYANLEDIRVVAGGTRIVAKVPDGSTVVFVFLSGNPQKNFGNITLQKFIFLFAARHGLLQKRFDISGCGNVSLDLLNNWYKELSEDARFIVQHPSYNLTDREAKSTCQLL